jgi:PknH-like extracellular domain
MNTDLTTLLHDRAQRVPTAMHPAADLRRQAERHQRVRRAGAVAAATSAFLVITVAGFLSQAGDRDTARLPAKPTPSVSPSVSPSLSPSVSPDAEPAAVTSIPAAFRFAEEDASAEWREPSDENQIERSNNRVEPWALDPCNPTAYPSDQRTAMRTLRRSGPEFAADLQLALYPDASTAASVLADFTSALDRCRDTSPDGGTTHRIWTSEDLDIADGGVIAILRYEVDGLQPPGSQHVAAYRTGNAIFMRSSSGEGLPQAGQPDPTRDEVTASAEQNQARVCELVRCEGRE